MVQRRVTAGTAVERAGRKRNQRQGRSRTLRYSIQLQAVATPTRAAPPTAAPPKRSKNESIKENSDYLRHPLISELNDPSNGSSAISEDAVQLLKFHGSYQQDHREERSFSDGKQYQFMMRTRQPAGTVTNQLYRAMDDLSDAYGNGTMRLTTRQTFQLHGILKQDLKTVFSDVIRNMGSTLSACGDVNRNTMAPPAPFKSDKRYAHASQLAVDIADLLAPQAGAYYDVWLDGERFMSHEMESSEVTKVREDNSTGTNFPDSPEPIYGSQFMPRKFKVATTVPGDNHLDVFTNDIAVIVICDDNGNLQGANIAVGGGMGKTHGKSETSPFVAQELGFVTADKVLHAVKAIACVQRDYGRRDDRKQARLKYLVRDWGIDRFKQVVEQYLGSYMSDYVKEGMPEWEFKTYLGWGEQGDGLLFKGVHVQNGRLKGQMKEAIRKVVDRFELPVTITANQDLILRDIDPAWKAEIDNELASGGARDEGELSQIAQASMACPAMPLCGLAITEAERGLPHVQERVEALMRKVGLGDEPIILRMTGCPNGCARPYMAELGLVGDGPNSYELWLGGSQSLTRLAEPFQKQVKVSQLESTLEPILFFFKSRRRDESESFGDFVERVGFDTIKSFQQHYTPLPALTEHARTAGGTGAAREPRVNVERETFELLEQEAARQGKTLSELATQAIRSFASAQQPRE